MRGKLLVALALAGAMAGGRGFAQTSTWMIDPEHSMVKFNITHLEVGHVDGTFLGVKGEVKFNEQDITKSTVTATIDTSTVQTGSPTRDMDLRGQDFFHLGKFLDMTFTSTSLTRVNGKLQMTGELTLVGVTKTVTLDVEGPVGTQISEGKTICGFAASGTISRKDFDFGQKYGPAMIGDAVKFELRVQLDKN